MKKIFLALLLVCATLTVTAQKTKTLEILHTNDNKTLDWSACEVVVGTYDGECSLLEEACHVLKSEVELMVAYRHSVISHAIHQSHLYIALEQCVER